MLMVECAPRSGLPLLFDGIIGEVGYDCTSNTHDHNYFPKEWNVAHSGELMSERWLSVDEIAAHLGVNPDSIYKWISRKSMPALKIGRLRKCLASEIDQRVKPAKTNP